MHDVHKQQESCTTFGYNPKGEIPIAWKFLLETYGYVFHSAVQNSLYQYAR